MDRYCVQSDLERAVGGARNLKELLDKDGDGQADADLIGTCLDEGSLDLRTSLAVNLQLDVGQLRAPYAPAVVQRAAHCAAYHAWVLGTNGQAVPPWIEERRTRALEWAKAAGLLEVTLGTASKPTPSQRPRIVDPDPDGTGISRRGFAKGFR